MAARRGRKGDGGEGPGQRRSEAAAPAAVPATPGCGRVVECSAMSCGHNHGGVCQAPAGILVMFHGDHADCVTYTGSAHKLP